jgi:hypothetical protein
MGASALIRLMGKGLSKTGKKESSEVAKKSTDLIGRRDEKFMGMVDEVPTKRLSGPAAEAEKRGSKAGVIAAGIGAGAGAGIAALSSRDKEETSSSTRREKGSRFQEDRPMRDAGRVMPKAEDVKKSSNLSPFGSAFKEARAAGKDVFTYEGKKYTTELAGEKKTRKVEAEKPTGVREGRNENIDEDTRKRAMESVANLNKGGYVNCGASMKPQQGRK